MANGVTPVAKPAINLDALAPLGAVDHEEHAGIVEARRRRVERDEGIVDHPDPHRTREREELVSRIESLESSAPPLGRAIAADEPIATTTIADPPPAKPPSAVRRAFVGLVVVAAVALAIALVAGRVDRAAPGTKPPAPIVSTTPVSSGVSPPPVFAEALPSAVESHSAVAASGASSAPRARTARRDARPVETSQRAPPRSSRLLREQKRSSREEASLLGGQGKSGH
mgnify:CR=1 FL=1